MFKTLKNKLKLEITVIFLVPILISYWESMMLGNMMQEQLLISGVLEHAVKNNANSEIVNNTVEGGINRYTIKDSALRSKKLANAC